MKSTEKRPSQSRPSRETLTKAFGEDLEFDKPLAPFTSFRTGGPARWFLQACSAEQAARAIREARKLGLDYFLIGGGSNLLISDKGFDGLIVKIDIQGLKIIDKTTINCGAGVDLMGLVQFAEENSLTGLEFAVGIWGTVGGAIYGNAGAFGGEIGDIITDVTLISPEGEIMQVNADYCRFGYRDSYLKKSGDIIVSARLKLEPGDRKEIANRIEETLALRVTKHPEQLTAGCFFKNIPDDSQPYGKLPAGKLLEESGAKDLQVGGAKVFERHANIVVNTGSATSADICALGEKMRKLVKEKFDIELEEEVIKIGEF